MSKDTIHWEWGANTLQDVEIIRDAFKNYLSHPFNVVDFKDLFDKIIENGLRREIDRKDQENISITPSEKQKLETERDKFHDQAEDIYKWFCYYQDKCKELEKIISK